MHLERIAISLRRRTPWEALDLGSVMLRGWAKSAYKIWCLTYWPVGILLGLLLWENTWIALVILWWIKPLFDRGLLFVFSRSLFGGSVELRDFGQSIGSLLKHSGLLYGLTLGRLSFLRSFKLPVWQLEGMKGKAARNRAKVLSRRTGEFGILLTIVCFTMTFIFYLSLFFLFLSLLPQGVGDRSYFNWWFHNVETPWMDFFSLILYMFAETLVEPFFMASGFSLYLNRRSELEAWDIELAFRRLNARLKSVKGHLLAVFILGLFIFSALFAMPEIAYASEGYPENRIEVHVKKEESLAQKTIKEVLANPDFGQQKKEMVWQRKKEEPKEEKELDDDYFAWLSDLFKGFNKLLKFISEMGRGIIWLIAAISAITLIYIIIVNREKWLGGREAHVSPPDFLFGLDVRPTSLPDDISQAALTALNAGKVEEALSLLYRGALMRLIHRDRIEFQPGDTEGDCRQRIDGKIDSDASLYFGDLLDTWLATVYAKITPPMAVLKALCQNWNEHFSLQTSGSVSKKKVAP